MQTYELDDLAKLLKFSSAYVKMVLKKIDGYDPAKPITGEIAERLAEKLGRPWPPEAQATK